ncbi:MAG: MarR family winged helix-turn-helix transcriptional regulator [Sphingomonas sp.]
MHHDSLSGPCACTLLRKAARAVGRFYDEALAGAGMTTAQFAILRHLSRTDALPLSRLAEQLVLDRTSLYRAVAPLIDLGWVAAAPGHGKEKRASLTAAGRAAMRAAEPGWEEAQRRLLGGMDPAAWARIEAQLRILTESALAN